ncbi:hypothetical protein ACFSKL_05850 [Belliella marina]|uniref:Tetratricopeptide repeat-containing protein n=1 Tax=Belliella marina TaxID=1644146 RepID=A0ABW4VJN4_9BACT
MKKINLIIAIILLSISISFANEAYQAAMLKEIKTMNQAGPATELQKSANAFGRIAQMNPVEWLPHYYAGLALVNASFRVQGGMTEKDNLLEEAKKHVEKAAAISPNNSEIVALDGYITMAELAADPASRGQHLSPLAMQKFGKAVELNRKNPRAIMMLGQMELGMAEFFGTGPEKGCGLINASLELFEKEASNHDAGNLNPHWGKEMAEQVKTKCK